MVDCLAYSTLTSKVLREKDCESRLYVQLTILSDGKTTKISDKAWESLILLILLQKKLLKDTEEKEEI